MNFWMTTLLLTLTSRSAGTGQSRSISRSRLCRQSRMRWCRKPSLLKSSPSRDSEELASGADLYPEHEGRQKLYAVPDSDQYLLQRVDFGKCIYGKSYSTAKPARPTGHVQGFAEVWRVLSKSLLRCNVTISGRLYGDDVPRSRAASTSSIMTSAMFAAIFLGTVRTWSSTCTPSRAPAMAASPAASGLKTRLGQHCALQRHLHRWQLAGRRQLTDYFHFDSWRENLQPGLWLPVGVYVEETQKRQGAPGLIQGPDLYLGLLA